ncbi:winged helix-turn-helix domain-containing protein [Flavobacterium psychrotrophum]|uniref:winged helix-turn-helix domain-containing protein n=1 Tax=Flavobacterium psychrotrophum TaxID=2294119 RepID=UPI000E31DE56|nr:winged helix-turn-helix domain-containing protein [Flavobacterium psychrotrophum]
MVKYVYILLGCAVVSLSAFVTGRNKTVPETEQIVSLRRIGHKLLLASNDSTSRVLPVKKVYENEFEIYFEKPIAIKPDALVAITMAEERAGLLPNNYTVTVNSCGDNAIQYAYTMPLKNKELPPCLGRALPEKCYYVSVKLRQRSDRAWLAAGLLPLFLFVGWQRFSGKQKQQTADNLSLKKECVLIGKVQYYPGLQKLIVKDECQPLTGKESRVLDIFAANINVEVPRERLQKEVWEDEGVIVGRSLDMFISKLRKKLKAEPAIQIVSIHGKGYKLIVNND